MKRQLTSTILIFFLILLCFLPFSVRAAENKEAGTAVTCIRSFYPKTNYENDKTYTIYAGDDLSFLPEYVSRFQYCGCTESPFILDASKCIFMYADWTLKHGPREKTDYSNIHFKIDNTSPGTYELIGKMILPEGCVFAEGLNVPEAHVFVHILEKTGKEEISFIAPWGFSLFTQSESVHAGDLSRKEDLLSLAEDGWTGVTVTEKSVPLNLTWDMENVDFHTPGTYQAFLTLSVPDNLQSTYSLPEKLAHYTKTIIVTDDNLQIYLRNIDDDYIYVNYSDCLPESAPITCCYLCSNVPLSESDLKKAEFLPCENSPFISATNVRFILTRNMLKQNTHYYFRIESGDIYSNTLHIANTDSLDASSPNLPDGNQNENRDGGDIVEPGQPSVTQPGIPESAADSILKNSSPQIHSRRRNSSSSHNSQNTEGIPTYDSTGSPDESLLTDSSGQSDGNPSFDNGSIPESQTDTPPESETDTSQKQNNSSTEEKNVTETVTEDSSTLSAGRISLMKQEYGDMLPFTHHGITAYIPASLFHLEDDDTVTVEIKKTGRDTFSFCLSVNKKTIPLTEAVQIFYPSEGTAYTSVYLEDTLTDITVSEQDGFASFYITENGTYRLALSDTEPISDFTEPASPIYPVILIPAAFLLLGTAGILIKRKGGKHA